MTAFVSSFFQAGIEVISIILLLEKMRFQYFIYIAYIVGIDVWHGPGEEKQKTNHPHGIERMEYTDGYEYQD